MVPKQDKDGYLCLSLYNTITGTRDNTRVQRVVMYTFGGNPPAYMDDPTVDHIDGNVLNNHISNLRWLSRVDNSSPLNKHTLAFKDITVKPRSSEELQLKYKEGVIKDYFDNGMRGKDICNKYHITQKLLTIFVNLL